MSRFFGAILGTVLVLPAFVFAGSDKSKTFAADKDTVYALALEFISDEWTVLSSSDRSIEFRASRTCEGTVTFLEKSDGTKAIVSTRKRQALVTWGEEGRKRKELLRAIEKGLGELEQ